MTNEEIRKQRIAVVKTAKTWLETPYHHGAAVKGAGVDCVNMPAASYNEALAVNIQVHDYSPQWHLHQTDNGKFNEMYLKGLIAQGFVEISDGKPNCEPFDKEYFVDALKDTGDMVIVKLARTYAHGGIIIKWPRIIQCEASPMGRGKVVEATTEANWYFTAREMKFFSRKEWHVGSIQSTV